MKLSTILRHGEARPALVITNEINRCRWCLDLAETGRGLKACGGGRDRGLAPVPSSLLGIIEGGQAVLDGLKRMEERLLRHVDRGRNWDLYDGDTASGPRDRPDADLFDPALVPAQEVRWLPPIPDVPLFITFHGNGVPIWRDRLGTVRSHALPRGPACRIHPITAMLGHEEPMVFPRGSRMGFANELGVVIAPGGRDIPFHEAWKHVWGITNCNDANRSGVWPSHYGRPPKEMVYHELEGFARLGLASDAASSFGPWITTIDEVPNVHDVLIHCWGPDGSYCRAHSSAYLMGPRNAVEYFSRFMTLPAGTTFQFGAPGIDGVGEIDDVEKAHGKCCDMDMEHVGILSNPLWCEERLAAGREPGKAFYGYISRQRGLDVAAAFCGEAQPFPRGTRSIWAARYNDRATARQEEFAPHRRRFYEIFPARSLSTGEPVELPAHATEVQVSCELAAVFGTRQAARLAETDVVPFLEGITIMVGLRDGGLRAELESPTNREAHFCDVLGRWYDGFNAVRPQLAAPADLEDLGDRTMRLSIDGVGEAETRSGDYLVGFGPVASFISREITFLPGDLISLGPAGGTLKIPAGHRLPAGAEIRASIEGIGDLIVPLVDQRAFP